MHDIQGGKPQACPLVFNFQKALNIPSFLIIPNILIIQIILISSDYSYTPPLPYTFSLLSPLRQQSVAAWL